MTENFGTPGVRSGSYDTAVIEGGRPAGAIIAPAAPEYQRVAESLSQALAAKTGVVLPVLPDSEASAGRGRGLRTQYREIPTLLMGNINNNEALIPLYARFNCFSDAAYPGMGGYELRTIRNPWGTQANVLLLGASDIDGLKKAVEAFVALPALQAERGCARYGFVMSVRPLLSAPVRAELEQTIADAQRFASEAAADSTLTIDEGQAYKFPMAFLLTGDASAAQALRLNARNMAATGATPFSLNDYNLEAYARLIQITTSSNLVDVETVQQLDRQALAVLDGMRNEYWLVTHAGDIGSRHQMSGTLAYLTLTDLLLKNLAAGAAPEVRHFLEEQFAGAYSHYKYIVENSYAGNEDNNSTATNMTSVLQFALSYGETAGFENGQVDIGVRKMIASVDNLGYGPGAGSYEDSYPGATKEPYRNGAPLAIAAFYHRDSKLKWLFENRPGLQWGSWFARDPFGLHQYATGDFVPAREPASNELNTFWVGHKTVDSQDYRASPGFPEERLFDKAVIRTGFAPGESYLIFQGLQIPENSEAGAEDALNLLRYTDRGELWLAGNCRLRDSWWRNSFVVSDGFGGSGGDGAPRLDVCAAEGDVSAFSGTLREVRGGQWNRWAVHLRGRFTVVTDTFTAGMDGDYAFATSWKTPVPAQLEGNGLVADKTRWRFRIQGVGVENASLDHGLPQMDAQKSWYLRQTARAHLRTEERASIANVLCVREWDSALWPDITQLDADTYLVRDIAGETLVGRGPYESPAFATDAAIFVIEASRATLFGGTFLRLGGQEIVAGAEVPFDSAHEVQGDFAALLRGAGQQACHGAGEQSTPGGTDGQGEDFGLTSVRTSLHDFALVPNEIRGFTVSPEPWQDGHRLDDNIVNWHEAAAKLNTDQPLVVDFQREVTLEKIVIETDVAPLNDKGEIVPKPALKLDLEVLSGETGQDNSPLPVSVTFEPDIRELYKMDAWQVDRYVAEISPTAVRRLKIQGLPHSIARLKFFAAQRTPAEILDLRAVDLDGDGDHEFLVRTVDRRLTAFKADGAQLFSVALPYDIIDFVCADFDDTGHLSIVVASQDLRLYRFDHKGELVRVSDTLFQHPYALTVLKSGKTGKHIALSYYYHCEIFDPDLQPVWRSPMLGAMWLSHAAAVDLDGSGGDDLVTSDIFTNLHCIAPDARKVVAPFRGVKGLPSSIVPWGAAENGERPLLLAGTSGVGVRYCRVSGPGVPEYCWSRGMPNESPADDISDPRDWTVSDGAVLAAAIAIDLDRDDSEELVLAKTVGHLVVLNHGGEVLRTIALPGTLRCLKQLQHKNRTLLLAGTSTGLYAYDNDWNLVAFRSGGVQHVAVSGLTIVLADDDQALNLLQLATQC